MLRYRRQQHIFELLLVPFPETCRYYCHWPGKFAGQHHCHRPNPGRVGTRQTYVFIFAESHLPKCGRHRVSSPATEWVPHTSPVPVSPKPMPNFLRRWEKWELNSFLLVFFPFFLFFILFWKKYPKFSPPLGINQCIGSINDVKRIENPENLWKNKVIRLKTQYYWAKSG